MFTIYDDISWKTSGTNWMCDTPESVSAERLGRGPAAEMEHERPREAIGSATVTTESRKEQENRNPFYRSSGSGRVHLGFETGRGSIAWTEPMVANPQPPASRWRHHHLRMALPAEYRALDAGWTIENVTMEDGVNYVWKWKEHERQGLSQRFGLHVNGSPKTALAYAWSPEVDLSGMQGATLSFSPCGEVPDHSAGPLRSRGEEHRNRRDQSARVSPNGPEPVPGRSLRAAIWISPHSSATRCASVSGTSRTRRAPTYMEDTRHEAYCSGCLHRHRNYIGH